MVKYEFKVYFDVWVDAHYQYKGKEFRKPTASEEAKGNYYFGWTPIELDNKEEMEHLYELIKFVGIDKITFRSCCVSPTYDESTENIKDFDEEDF